MKTVLTIAGSDSIGGAGIQADIKTITCNGCYAMSAITAMTAQNTLSVKSVLESTPQFLADQLDAVFEDIVPDAVKVGMVKNSELVKVVAEKLKQFKASNIVVDPVLVSTSGTKLLDDDAAEILTSELFPLATLVTPNIPEAEFLSGARIGDSGDMEKTAGLLSEKFGCSVLLKGGHRIGDASDYLHSLGIGIWFDGNRLPNKNTHGTGCTLSSAIASNLALGFSLEESVLKSKEYMTRCIEAGLDLGHGQGPLMHNFMINNK